MLDACRSHPANIDTWPASDRAPTQGDTAMTRHIDIDALIAQADAARKPAIGSPAFRDRLAQRAEAARDRSRALAAQHDARMTAAGRPTVSNPEPPRPATPEAVVRHLANAGAVVGMTRALPIHGEPGAFTYEALIVEARPTYAGAPRVVAVFAGTRDTEADAAALLAHTFPNVAALHTARYAVAANPEPTVAHDYRPGTVTGTVAAFQRALTVTYRDAQTGA